MIEYDPSYLFDVGDRFSYRDKIYKAIKAIPNGVPLVLFNPETGEGNYKEV